MPTLPADCANHAINQEMCPCTNVECGNHGICCECLRAHVGYGQPTACMNGRARTVFEFSRETALTCEVNGKRNAEWCPCSNEACLRRGVCCNCVRNHWTAAGTGRVACMKGL
jgi:hypothetical protein